MAHTTREIERRLLHAEADLRDVVGADADDQKGRSPFVRASTNLSTWAARGQRSGSQLGSG